MELKRIIARDSRAANDKAIQLYGPDVLVISSQRVDNQTELIVAIDTDEDARRLFTSPQQQWVNRFRGMPGPLPPPVENMTGRWSPTEEAQIAHMLTYAFVGSASTVHRDLERFLERAMKKGQG